MAQSKRRILEVFHTVWPVPSKPRQESRLYLRRRWKAPFLISIHDLAVTRATEESRSSVTERNPRAQQGTPITAWVFLEKE